MLVVAMRKLKDASSLSNHIYIYILKEHTTVVDRQVYTKYACGFTANKV